VIESTRDPNKFKVDFAKVPRPSPPGLLERARVIFTSVAAASILDPYAIRSVLVAMMDRCRPLDVNGAPWLWNHYTFFLAETDLAGLAPMEAEIRAQVLPVLHEELIRRGVTHRRSVVVRWVPDENGEVPPGAAVIWGQRLDDVASAAPIRGEVTVRGDRIVKESKDQHPDTERDYARLSSKSGSVGIPEGRRCVLGRDTASGESSGTGSDSLGLPGTADNKKISRRQVAILLCGNDAEIGREANANPVRVGERDLAEGETLTVSLPVEIVLSKDQWRGSLSR